MDIVEIKSFLAVIEFRSFTLAAKRVHITQSAMSKRIQKMENELGVRLFIVEGSKITLTEAASHFVPYARQMLAAYNSAIKSFKDDAQMLQHHVVVWRYGICFPLYFAEFSQLSENDRLFAHHSHQNNGRTRYR
ncbi:LysR family transcriptional regulator [Legionella sainthelensi]|uniref:LysR family transcriptional regulator n=1 Tax=Legionella sainthelensi TaxID=28087 RepID=UPI000F6CE0E9|nr:LysR family transcriptional regulator [Legionella sainthelensi]VEB38693.1 LysR family transcriptional regulator [Legionella sainthelensi]